MVVAVGTYALARQPAAHSLHRPGRAQAAVLQQKRYAGESALRVVRERHLERRPSQATDTWFHRGERLAGRLVHLRDRDRARPDERGKPGRVVHHHQPSRTRGTNRGGRHSPLLVDGYAA
jgi:hypothetical protein